MSVPTHNLYDFVHQVTKKRFYLLYYYPWGSRNLYDVKHYQIDPDWMDGPRGIQPQDRINLGVTPCVPVDWKHASILQPILFCHDQEPLNYDLYQDDSTAVADYYANAHAPGIATFQTPYTNNLNLRLTVPHAMQKKWILLHSELNSKELARYEETGEYVGAYWWSHAAIARDWYRFAEHDTALCHNSNKQKLFLTYCRDSTGSREYRKSFLQQISAAGIFGNCQTQSFDGTVGSDASAEYNITDINNTAISVVLETVFDSRIHLTEKILRPIACGHPFILAGGPGSLRLLRSYGFRTFAGYINESYDEIQDSQERLSAIVKEMKRICDLPIKDQQQLIEICQEIAQFNQKHFFSNEFFTSITDELKRNVDSAYSVHMGEISFDTWWAERKWRKKNQPAKCRVPYYREYIIYLILLYRKWRQQVRVE
jgi:hypothetical protein